MRTGTEISNVMKIEVATSFSQSPSDVWNYLSDISSHVDWMHDAVAIEFSSEQRAGVGTSFVCQTVVGPLKTQDVMTITEWIPDQKMGVSHLGLVSGSGYFQITGAGDGSKFSWVETLTFPWFFAGRFGEIVAKPILNWMWKRNLKALGDCLNKSQSTSVDGENT